MDLSPEQLRFLHTRIAAIDHRFPGDQTQLIAEKEKVYADSPSSVLLNSRLFRATNGRPSLIGDESSMR